ncbi:MAG: patatin-like phospholipase family protein [Bacteroidia bacterium]|nr:patatin-like phospholipase family protein [Bacteroidia bacterium]
MIRVVVFFLVVFLAFDVEGQKVGLVLSGGGAKGLAHIGVLKALEENGIPIDYVVGTSMGGIVAGCYAAGFSPAQIEEIALSDNFQRWVSGKLEEGYNYYYNKNDDYPSFLKLNISLDSTLNFNFNTSLANDISLNFALAELMAQSSSISKNNFDSLFVPLRVVAADIFTQTEAILKDGVLSDAMRATQTVPLFYDPIRVDGKFLFDGGVYNNFPVDVAQKEFKPDVIIGANVSTKVYEEYPFGEDEKLVSRSLLYMLLDKSDPNKVPLSGIYIQPNLKGYTAFDFAKAKNMIDSGYAQTIKQMSEIKAKIAAKADCEDVADRRNAFNGRANALVVDNVRFTGFNSRQQRYLHKFFSIKKNQPLYFYQVKSGYYKLIAEDYFKNVYPGFLYNPDLNRYEFQLSKRPQNNFQVDFGGAIATRSISGIFLGLNYYYFNRMLTHASANFYAGTFYKSAQVKARLDMPSLGQYYVEPEATFNSWDFIQGSDFLIASKSPTILKRIDRKVGASIGKPVGKKYKASLSGYYVNNTDRFINTQSFISTDTLDLLSLSGYRSGFKLSTNVLNRKQYANQGHAYEFSFDWFSLIEELETGTTSNEVLNTNLHRAWVRARVTMEQYFKKGFYSSGYYFDAVFSNQPLFSNYQSTIINAPSFNPIQDSHTLLLRNYRAFNYVAGGWRNVFSLRNNLDFRLEGYLFKPFEQIKEGSNQEATLNLELTNGFFAATAGLVLHTTVGPVSLSVNYYDDNNHQFGALLHVGFLLFNRTSLE